MRLTYVFAATPYCPRIYGGVFDLVVEELYDSATTNTTIVRNWNPDIPFSSQQDELPLWISIFKLNFIYRHQASPVATSFKFSEFSLKCVWRAFYVHAYSYRYNCANNNEHFCDLCNIFDILMIIVWRYQLATELSQLIVPRNFSILLLLINNVYVCLIFIDSFQITVYTSI